MKNLLKVINLKCVQNVNFGLKKIKVVIIWHVDVDINFVMNVVVSICNVNVCKNNKNCLDNNNKECKNNCNKDYNQNKREVREVEEDHNDLF